MVQTNHKNFDDLGKKLEVFLSIATENHASHLKNLETIKKMCIDSSGKQIKDIENAITDEMEKATNQWHQVMENFEDLSERLDVQVNKCSKLSEKLMNQVSG